MAVQSNEIDDSRETISYLCNFGLLDTYKRFEKTPEEKIIIRELNEFGHESDRPQGVRKLNILV